MAQSYRKYKKGVKRLGGKQIATRAEYKIVKSRMKAKEKGRFSTARTQAIEGQLRKSGLTQKEINRLRGRK